MNRRSVGAVLGGLVGGMIFWVSGASAEGQNPCLADQQKFCAGVRPGEGRLLKCLKDHDSELSDACRQWQQRGENSYRGPSRPSSQDRSNPQRAAQSSEELLQRAKEKSADHYREALAQGAQIHPTPDGRSFYLIWSPPGKRIQETTVLVGLHGHGSWVVDEFAAWQALLIQRGYSLVALQWWFGGGETTHDYYLTQEVSDQLEAILAKEQVKPGRAFLHGFSRGATQTYGLIVLDRQRTTPYFPVAIANAGGAASDYPVHQKIEQSVWGEKPFAGSKWVLFCGGQDPNPDRDGCPAMQRTQAWIERWGGDKPLLIEDPNAGHGGFHRNPANARKALDFVNQQIPKR